MQVTISYLSLPVTEDMEEGWRVTFSDAGGFWNSAGFAHVKGDIAPSAPILIEFLSKNNIIKTSLYTLQNLGRMSRYDWNYPSESDLNIVNTTIEFCKNHLHRTISHHGHSTGEALFDGNRWCREEAINKIKKDIRIHLPNPKRELLTYLQNAGLVSKSINPACDTLSKPL